MLIDPSAQISALQDHTHRPLSKSQLDQIKSNKWIWQLNKDTDPDAACYCSLALLQQPTQALLCPMPLMAVTTKGCCRALGLQHSLISTWWNVPCQLYTKATEKPKAAVGTNTVSAMLGLTLFLFP